MKEEKIRSLLFGKKSDVPLRTIKTIKENGLFPYEINETSAKRWRNTFIGQFLFHYPKRSCVIFKIKEALGKMPTLSDFTESNLNKIVEVLKEDAPNSARQNASQIKSTLTRLMESDDCNVRIPCKRYAKILSLEGCPTTKTYMNIEDFKAFLNYEPKTNTERNVKALFAVMVITGARYNDVVNFKRANIQDGVLTYVPQKTKSSGTVVSIPVSEQTTELISWIELQDCNYFIGYFNKCLRDICKNCGLDEEVTYFWGGKYHTKPKYEAMRSHLGRTSFVTNMLKLGLQIQDVQKMAGHTDIAMTSRYNASTDVKLTKEADDFINMKF